MPRENLTICFSGGGFRAMLFHLGVVRALRDVKLLPDINHIFSVSGGSILAAHLVLKWDQYTAEKEDTFRACARELIQFAQKDLRGRILRRWLLFGWLPHFDRTRQLARHYDELFDKALLDNLSAKDRPKLHIMATNMVTGEACFFERRGIVRIAHDRLLPPIPAAALRLADAVTASSAFPPMFPPFTRTAKELGFAEAGAPGVLRFTDGGVFDNTGVRAARLVVPEGTLLISDASASFDQATDRAFRTVVARTIRTTDILMGRVARLEEQQLAQTPSGRSITGHIASFVEPSDVTRVHTAPAWQLQSRAFQEWVRNVRTDLDYFPDDVIRSVFRHGYEVGLRMSCELRPSAQFPITTPYWDPCSHTTGRQDSRETGDRGRMQRIGDHIRRVFSGIHLSAPISIDVDALAKLKQAANRSPRLWNSSDALCWAFVVLAGGILAVSMWMYWDRRPPAELVGQGWTVVDVGSAGSGALKQKLDETGLSYIVSDLTLEADAYRKQVSLMNPVTVTVAHSLPLARPATSLRVCSGIPGAAYHTFAWGAVFLEQEGATYGRLVPVERTETNAFRLDLPSLPKGSTVAFIVAAVSTQAIVAAEQYTASLARWRMCDDVSK